MKKILIFGGTQFVGKRLISNLLEKGYDITVASRGNWPVPHLNSIKHVIADRYKPESFGNLVDQEWDVIVDQLAFSGYDAKVLLDAFKSKVKRIVCVTSSAVYDSAFNCSESDFDSLKMDISKIDLENYQDPKADSLEYQKGKREVEHLYLTSGVSCSLIRFPIILGLDDLSMRFYNLYKLVKKDEELKLDDINIKLSFISSREAARFLSFCIDHDIDGPVNANLNGDFSIELLEKILKQKIKYSISSEANTFLIGGGMTLDNSLAQKAGFKFESLEDYLRELTIQYSFYN